ncbi:DMT family transporter [Desulfurococcus mucosus]|uniref:EamA domain-containing protein n=1 Tax=Desulfurococcus mucosus (strain ATCC 35584 / DSM 2162 / JCM 9187 / O7/1) TaxID=765177 RepID=E8R919_DESM0|nr:DMT family transporter [Desulfurococcus mucosus]ADV64995.1 protein of unknown function DUF6 transmembrane [Desulfurococcus mucosus DSM 2162]
MPLGDMATGLLYLGLSVLMWSLTPSLISMDKARYNSFTANGLRALLAGVVMLPFTAEIILENPVDYLTAGALLGLIGILVGDSLYILTIRRLGPGLAVVLCYSYVATTQLLKQLVAPGGSVYVAVAASLIAIVGMYIAVREQLTFIVFNTTGLLAAALTNISWAAWSLISWIYVKGRGLNVLALTSARFIIPGLILTVYSTRRHGARELFTHAPRKLRYTMLSGLTGYLVGGTAYLESLKYIDVSQATIATAAVPVLSQLISSTTTGSRIRRSELAGALLVALSIVISSLYS